MGSVGGSQHEGSFPGSGKGGGVVGSLSRGRVEGLSRGSHGMLGAVLMALKKIPDVERGITRIFHGTATASEVLVFICHSFSLFSLELAINLFMHNIIVCCRDPSAAWNSEAASADLSNR